MTHSEPADFKTIQTVFEPRRLGHPDHTVQKFTMSTEVPEAALIALTKYYGEAHLMEAKAHREMIAQGFGKPSVYAYVTKTGRVEVVMGEDAFYLLQAHPQVGNGSIKAMTQRLRAYIAALIDNDQRSVGQIRPLYLFSFEEQPIPKGLTLDQWVQEQAEEEVRKEVLERLKASVDEVNRLERTLQALDVGRPQPTGPRTPEAKDDPVRDAHGKRVAERQRVNSPWPPAPSVTPGNQTGI